MEMFVAQQPFFIFVSKWVAYFEIHPISLYVRYLERITYYMQEVDLT